MNRLLLLLLTHVLVLPALAAPGDLDPIFGTAGITDPVVSGNAHAIARQIDGKVVVAGNRAGGTWEICRYTETGQLDPSFSGDGWLTVDVGSGTSYAHAVKVQTDGKIVVGGFSSNPTWNDFALVRLNQDGTLDTSFSGDGKIVTPVSSNSRVNDVISSIEIQSDGKILAIGAISNNKLAVVRYHPNGSIDTSYGTLGISTFTFGDPHYVNTSALQPDGKLLVGGSVGRQSAICRLDTDGSVDTSFSGDGWVVWDVAAGDENEGIESIAIQGDGKIVASGTFSAEDTVNGGTNEDYFVFRTTSSGSFDSTFAGNGKLTIPIESAPGSLQGGNKGGPFCLIRPDDKILLAGWFPRTDGSGSTWCLSRLNANGGLDATFSGDGFASGPDDSSLHCPYDLIAEPGGKVLAPILSGNFRVARFIVDDDTDGDGVDDPSEVAAGTSPTDDDSDDDGLTDGEELILYATDPLDDDSDDDGLLDGAEVQTHGSNPNLTDSDGDGLDDSTEVQTYGTNPSVQDTDGDGLSDFDEAVTYGHDPLDPDMDDDGLSDGMEILTVLSDPNNPDSDGDGYNDGYEHNSGFSPTDAASKPIALLLVHKAVELEVITKIGVTYRVQVSDDLKTWTDTDIMIPGTGGAVRDVFQRTTDATAKFWRVREE